MQRQSKFFTLATAASMLLSIAGMGNPIVAVAQGNGPGGSSSSGAAAQKAPQFEEVKVEISAEEAKTEATYIVTLADAPAALYAGGAGQYAPTAAFATGSAKLDVKSEAFAAYSKFLDGKQAVAKQAISKELGRDVKANRTYKIAANGFAMTMTGAEAAKVRGVSGVLAVRKVTIYHLDTDAGPTWIGANSIWDGTSTGGLPATKGEGIIAGILDTGINYDHPSFADVGGDGYNHTNPYGAGNYKGECANTPSYCNDKLVGIYDELGEGVYNDEDGHGSHTSSTTAGNVIHDSVISKPAGTFTATMISGVAPHANVIMYRVCSSGCPSDAIISGLEHAIADGVDVINYSIGSDSPSDPWAAGSDEQTFLAVRAAGIFVANSAGNAGNNASTIGSPTTAPWLIGVAATRHNRAYVTMVNGLMGGNTTPPGDLHGEALTGGIGMSPIVYAGSAPYNDNLCANADQDGAFAGKIVVCDRGTVGRVQKGINVKARGAVGMILVEVDNSPYAANIGGITSDPHVLPASHLGYSDGVKLKAWLATGTGHMGSISAASKVMDASTADIVASFSSRGPSRSVPDLLVPGIGAPGVSIWAAYADPVQYDMIQGTSMASPHLAGAAALVRAVHPEWNATQVQSALQLTAKYAGQYKEDGLTMADPLDIGNGRVDLTAAANAAFVMDESVANFTAANPANGGDPKKLNLTQMGNARCITSCTWTRTISSTRSTAVAYNVTTSSNPSVTLTAQPSSFTLAPYGKQVITVTMNVANATLNVWQFGRVKIDAAASAQSAEAVPASSLTVGAVPLAAALPPSVDVTIPRNSGQTDVEITTGAVTALQTAVSGLVKGTQFTSAITEDSSNGSPWDDLTDGVVVKPFFVPPGTVRLYGEMLSSTAPDMDLFLVRDMNGDRVPQSGEVVASSTSGSWTEKINRTNPTAGYYFWVVQDWNGGSAQPDTFKFSYGIVPSADAGNMTVSAPASITPGVPYNLTFKYNLPNAQDGDVYYGLVTLGSSAATPSDLGRIPVNIRRIGNDVTKTASASVAAVGDVVTYTLSIQNPGGAAFNFNLTDTIPAGMSYVPGSVTGAGASYNSGLNAIVVNGNAAATVKGDYAIEDNMANENLVNDSPFGGYVDLRDNGFTVNPFGDDVAGNFNTLGCNLDYWGATGGSATRIGFSSNGLFFPRGTQVAGGSSSSPYNMSIPSVITPNNFIAAYWSDLVISPTANFTQSGYMAATAGTCPDRAMIVQLVNASSYDEPTKALNYELQWYSAYPDEYWVLYDTVSTGLLSGTVGAEDYTGTKGVSYFDNGSPAAKALTSGRVLRYYRPLVAAPPIVVTYQAKVEANAADIIPNSAEYTTDLPGTVAMQSGTVNVRRADAPASLTVVPLWQPIVANGYDATVLAATVKDNTSAAVANQKVLFTTGNFMAALKGENEVPAVSTSAMGMAKLTMTPGQNGMVSVNYWIDVTNIVSITSAHIHSGMAGANGGVSYWLYAGGTPFGPGKPLSGTLEMSKQDAMVMMQHGMYVNVHTSANPAGEIRGQIVEEAMNASLASSKEVAVPATIAWGNALFTYDPETRNLTYRLDVNSDTTATAAHIHDGAEGVNGPVLYNLLPAGKELKPGTSLLGEVTLSAADEVKLLNGGLYVNVHTADAPAGAMRGQIGPLMSYTDMNGMAYMPLASRMAGLKTVYAMTMPDVMASTTVQFNEMLAGQEFYVRPMNTP